MADPRPGWLAPDAPADPKPRHWRQRTLAEVGINGKAAQALVAAGLGRLGAVADAMEAGPLPKIAGVGPGTMDKLKNGIVAWKDGRE